VDKDDYLLVLESSPVKATETKQILKAALTDKFHNLEGYMKGVNASYHYEGYNTYKISEWTEVTDGREGQVGIAMNSTCRTGRG